MEKKEIIRKLKEILSKHEGNTSEGAIYWDSEWVGGKQIPTGGGGYRQEGGKLVCKDKEFYQEMADFISQELDKARREYFSMGMEYFSLIDDSNIYQKKGWKLSEEKAERLQILGEIFNLLNKQIL